jgi:hypothetical protein
MATALNVVRFKVKPGYEEQFVEAHRTLMRPFKGFLGGYLVKTGERTYCWVGEWRGMQSIVDARPQMISILDGFRAMLEDLGGGLGVTDPISGESVVKIPSGAAPKKRKAKAKPAKAKAKAKTAKRKAKKGS